MISNPLVTVAIPLYRSARFVDRISENLAQVDLPNAEILISDRHVGHFPETALPQLNRRWGNDPRVRFLEASDGLGWVGHYNALLREGTGKYFLWMTHDDQYPGPYVRRLVDHLESHPETLLAYGRLRQEDPEGRLHTLDAAPVAAGEAWCPRLACRLLHHWELGIAIRGVFRRETVIQRRLFIRPVRHGVRADRLWMFGVALRGRLDLVEKVESIKMVQSGGASSGWRMDLPTRLSYFSTALTYARDQSPPQDLPSIMASLWAHQFLPKPFLATIAGMRFRA